MSVRLWKKSSYNSTTFESKPQIIEYFFSNEMDGKVTTRYEIGKNTVFPHTVHTM